MNNIFALNMKAIVIFCFPLVSAVHCEALPLRENINLSGEWEYVASNVDNINALSKLSWRKVQVPGDMRNYTKAHHVWFKKVLLVPRTWEGQDVKIYFGNVCRRAIVYFNGKYVGKQEGGRMPFRINLTSLVKFGKPNTLLVKVSDMSIYQANPEEKLPQRIKLATWNPGNSGYNRFEGIVGKVLLEKYPKLYIADNFIVTSVTKKEINVQIIINNILKKVKKIKLTAAVLDNGKVVLKFPIVKKLLPSGKSKPFYIKQKWNNPKLWFPNNPKLYSLRLDIHNDNGKIIDQKITTFGFREFRCGNKSLGENPAFFYLNGRICKIRTTEISSYRAKGEDYSDLKLREKTFMRDFRCVKDAHINMIRFFELCDVWHYKVCNKLGMMVATTITRCEPWQTLLIGEKKFYKHKDMFMKYSDNMVEYVKRRVIEARNNPSIVMWGLSNENLHFREYEGEIIKHLLRLKKVVEELDPTRPVYFSGDGDLYGKADIITLHGVRGVPGRSSSPAKGILPNYAYFSELKNPRNFTTHRYFGLKGKAQWSWKFDKPVYFAEWPYTLRSLNSQKAAPIFVGEKAFEKPLWESAMLGDAVIMKAFLSSARYLDFPSIGPFTLTGASNTPHPPTIVTKAAKKYLSPRMATVKEWDFEFYANKIIPRTVTIYNGLYNKAHLTLNWEFYLENKKQASGEEEHELAAGSLFRKIIKLKMPEVKRKSQGYLRLILNKNGKKLYEEKHKIIVFPIQEALKKDSHIVLFDQDQTTKLPYKRIDKLDSIKADILIIGINAVTKIKDKNKLLKYAERGGKILILQQKEPYDLLPVRIPLKATISSSITFPSASGHPILKDIQSEDLQFWTGTGNERHVVSKNNLIKPILGNFRAIVAAGSGAGLNTVPLLEIPYGKGLIVASQMELTSKAGIAPQADILFRNIINYFKSYRSKWRNVKVLSNSNSEFSEGLLKLGISFDNIKSTNCVLKPAKDILLIDGNNENLEKLVGLSSILKKFVENGGKIYVCNVGRNSFDKLSELIGLNAERLTLKNEDFPLNRIADGKLVFGITSQEVFWQRAKNGKQEPGSYGGGGHYSEPLYKNIIDYGCKIKNSKEFISSGALSQYNIGKGTIVVDQINWVNGLKTSYKPLAMRYACSLFTNLGIKINCNRATSKIVGISNWHRSHDGKKVNTHYPRRYKEALDKLGLPYKMVDYKSFDSLRNFGSLIIMNGIDKEKRGRGLSRKEAKIISEYVKNGGNVLLERYAFVPALMQGKFGHLKHFTSGKITGIEFCDTNNSILKKLTKKLPFQMNATSHMMAFIPNSAWQGKVLAKWIVNGKTTDIPALVVGKYGKGKYAYISGEYYKLYESARRQDHKEGELLRQIFENLLDSLCEQNKIKKLKLKNCTFVDITKVCNRGFKDEIAQDGKGGWTDQGSKNDLAKMPSGLQYFNEIPFKIVNPKSNSGKSCLVLNSSVNAPKLPMSKTIELDNVKVDRLYFLHAAAWLDSPAGEEVFNYHILYGDADGTTIRIPVLNKVNIADWYTYKPKLKLKNTMNIQILSGNKNHAIYGMRWINPRPELPIQRIKIVSLAKTAIPIVLGITGITDNNISTKTSK